MEVEILKEFVLKLRSGPNFTGSGFNLLPRVKKIWHVIYVFNKYYQEFVSPHLVNAAQAFQDQLSTLRHSRSSLTIWLCQKIRAMPERTGLLSDAIFDDFDDFEFHRWRDLPAEIKIHVLEYLTFPTLRCFMFLSKECYDLVCKVKPTVDLYLADAAYLTSTKQQTLGYCDGVELHIYWCEPGSGPKSRHDYALIFVKEDQEGCFVQRMIKKKRKYLELPGIRYSSDILTAAVESMFGLSNVFDIRDLIVATYSPNSRLEAVLTEHPSSQKIARRKFGLDFEGEPSITKLFLRFLKPGCGIAVLKETSTAEVIHEPDLFNHNIIRCARKIQFYGWKAGMKDEQLVQLAADDIFITAPQITSRAINKLIQEWLEGKRIINVIEVDEVQINTTLILQDLDPSVIMRFEDFLKLTSYDGIRMAAEPTAPVIRSPRGFLMVLTDTNSCVLTDPYYDTP